MHTYLSMHKYVEEDASKIDHPSVPGVDKCDTCSAEAEFQAFVVDYAKGRKVSSGPEPP